MRIIDASRHYADQALANDVLLSLASRVGRPDFHDVAIDAIFRLVRVDHLSVFDEAGGEITCRLAASRSDRSVSPKIARLYASRFFRQDPSRTARDGDSPAVVVTHLHLEDVADRHYRAECYDRPGIAERLSVRSTARGGGTQICNLYRAPASGTFAEQDLAAAVTAASVLVPVLDRHAACLARGNGRASLPEIGERLRALGRGLTRREIEVLARGLIGMTGEGTGLDLGVQVTSVATYRKRAYAKLGISTQSELYARLLA